MTSSGKVRIYELSKDLGLENKDVLDAAEKLSIAAKSHSSSISDAEAGKIRSLLGKGGNGAKPAAAAPAKPAAGKAILSVKKAAPPRQASPPQRRANRSPSLWLPSPWSPNPWRLPNRRRPRSLPQRLRPNR